MASKPEGRLIRHDEPAHFTAYIAGQNDAIKQLSCDPNRHDIGDEYRRGRYWQGYKQEVEDLISSN